MIRVIPVHVRCDCVIVKARIIVISGGGSRLAG
jgi:hypothetical protein